MRVLGAVLLASVLVLPSAAPSASGQAPGDAACPLAAENPQEEVISLPPLDISAGPEEVSRRPQWSEFWGTLAGRGFMDGQRMAPNGQVYDPLFALDLDVNIGMLPNQKLYVFSTSSFWTEKAGQVTNPRQGIFDFSKREWNINAGVAWNVAGPLELRAFGYAVNNLNRGTSVSAPAGYVDGTGVEGRCYLPAEDRYDVSRRPFLAVGYLPSKVLIDGNGNQFAPGLFARAYLVCDLPLRSYAFLDAEGFTDDKLSPRMLYFDGGLAARPFLALPALEFRLGAADTFDVRVIHANRALAYGAIRILF